MSTATAIGITQFGANEAANALHMQLMQRIVEVSQNFLRAHASEAPVPLYFPAVPPLLAFFSLHTVLRTRYLPAVALLNCVCFYLPKAPEVHTTATYTYAAVIRYTHAGRSALHARRAPWQRGRKLINHRGAGAYFNSRHATLRPL